jgi:hypothetical protein
MRKCSQAARRTFGPLLNYMGMEHIPDHDLERYHLGMVGMKPNLPRSGCPRCFEQAEEVAYIDTLRRR